MSQQGEKPAAHEDDWWRRLYDENARDTGTSEAADSLDDPDSLDDRFDSASQAVGAGGGGDVGGPGGGSDGGAGAPPEAEAVVASEPGTVVASEPAGEGAVREGAVRERAPWEPPAATVRAPGTPPAGPTQPRTFATPPVPAGPPPPLSAPPPPSVPPLPRRPVAGKPAASQAPVTASAASTPPAASTASVMSTAFVAPGPPVAPTAPAASVAPAPEAERESGPVSRPVIGHVGDRPPTYDAEPTALPPAVPQGLDGIVADTVLDGARYGTYTLRAASVRGDSARFRGEPRRDALLTARFGTDERALVLVAVATGARATESAHLAADDACRWIGAAVGRSHVRLSEDIRAGRRGELKSGLHRLTDRTYGKLRARAAELGAEPQQYTAGLRCLLLSADPDCRTRIFFGIGAGGLFRLRDGVWQDLEPVVPAAGDLGTDPRSGAGAVAGAGAESGYGSGFEAGSGAESGAAFAESSLDGDRLTMDLAVTTSASPHAEAPPGPADPPGPPGARAEPFRFRGSVARPGDTLLLCSPGLAEPLRGEPALAQELAGRWAPEGAPGLVAFLADTQLRVKGYSDDRTGVGVWEA
ncbi:protein phosphatase 2C domain-containing protein [Streptomyces sp. NPDC056323]|uniref:protein phosphatase 2C domain-containing protein n=1 Tax=Streptomyces sp. NPDC056323 TaxID=3345784 RepID=UPI0035E248D9